LDSSSSTAPGFKFPSDNARSLPFKTVENGAQTV